MFFVFSLQGRVCFVCASISTTHQDFVCQSATLCGSRLSVSRFCFYFLKEGNVQSVRPQIPLGHVVVLQPQSGVTQARVSGRFRFSRLSKKMAGQ